MAKYLWLAVAVFLLVALLAACAASGGAGLGVAPTVSDLFNAETMTAQQRATRGPTATRRPTSTPVPPAAETATAEAVLGGRVVDWVIYDDQLDRAWSADDSWDIRLDLSSRKEVQSGAVSAAITPTKDYGAFFLALKEGGRTLPITDVIGVSLWINSGDDVLTPEDLAVTVIGSNDYTYWVKSDTSVELTDPRPFSESRLVHLGMNHSIPPHTWIEIVVRLDQLIYQPDFNYVTGVYVKNDKQFRQTYYVDRVAWQVIDRGSSK